MKNLKNKTEMREDLHANLFKIRTYGVGELARLYNPYSLPASATRQLRRWISYHPELSDRLHELGYYPGLKVFTPKQVECLVKHLGEP